MGEVRLDDNKFRIFGARRADVTGVGAWEPSCRGFGIAKILKKRQLHPRQGCHPVDVGSEMPRGRNEMPVDPISGRSAAEIIRLLDLRPHPEGGFFRETFRDPARDSRGRAVSTLIYFLLDAGQVSRWHKVDATEVWHFYAGAPWK